MQVWCKMLHRGSRTTRREKKLSGKGKKLCARKKSRTFAIRGCGENYLSKK